MDGSVTFLSVSPNWDAPIDVGEAETAAQAWQKVCNLQRSDEVIRFIKIISGGTSLDRGDYFVAVAASCGLWRVEGRESRRADTRGMLPILRDTHGRTYQSQSAGTSISTHGTR